MNKTTLIGISVGLIAVLVGFSIEAGPNFGMLFSVSSLLIVLGATAGATILSFGMTEIKQLGTLMKKIFREDKQDYLELVRLMEDFAMKARREGLLALENEIDTVDDEFIKKGLRSLIDGVEYDVIEETMAAEIESMEERHARGAKIFEAAAGYCPTMGIMGTVMHMLVIMKELNDPGSLGPKISAAFTATLYGVAFANLFFFPFSEKLKGKSKEEVLYKTMAMEGVLSIQKGINPFILREKLIVFLPAYARGTTEEETIKGGVANEA